MISAALALLETEEQRNELADFHTVNKNRLYYIALSKLHAPPKPRTQYRRLFQNSR